MGRDNLIVIPTYNEAQNLKPLIGELMRVDDSDLLVIDDASPDGTGRLADELASGEPRLSVVHRSAKLGLGSAHLLGVERGARAGYSSVTTMDGDYTHRPEDVPRLRGALAREGADVVIASRHLSKTGIATWSLPRRVITTTADRLTSYLLGLPYDCTNSLRIYRLASLDLPALRAVRTTGYAFLVEVTALCHRQGLKIAQIPVQLDKRRAGRSKMSAREIATGLTVLVRLSCQRLFLPKRAPDRVAP